MPRLRIARFALLPLFLALFVAAFNRGAIGHRPHLPVRRDTRAVVTITPAPVLTASHAPAPVTAPSSRRVELSVTSPPPKPMGVEVDGFICADESGAICICGPLLELDKGHDGYFYVDAESQRWFADMPPQHSHLWEWLLDQCDVNDVPHVRVHFEASEFHEVLDENDNKHIEIAIDSVSEVEPLCDEWLVQWRLAKGVLRVLDQALDQDPSPTKRANVQANVDRLAATLVALERLEGSGRVPAALEGCPRVRSWEDAQLLELCGKLHERAIQVGCMPAKGPALPALYWNTVMPEPLMEAQPPIPEWCPELGIEVRALSQAERRDLVLIEGLRVTRVSSLGVAAVGGVRDGDLLRYIRLPDASDTRHKLVNPGTLRTAVHRPEVKRLGFWVIREEGPFWVFLPIR